MSIRNATGEVTQERLDELALGKLNPKTGRRKGGFLNNVRTMPQWRDRVAAGEWGEDDLIEQAYKQAWNWLKSQAERAESGDVSTADEADAEFARTQEERYREEYDWDDSNANDDAGLMSLITLEVETRRLKRDLQRGGIQWKEKTELLSELRNIAKDHAALQKALGIDRPTRDSRRRNEDPMEALRSQIEAGATTMRALVDEWVTRCTEPSPERPETIDELRAMMKHHLGFPLAVIDATLAAHVRILAKGNGTAAPSDSTAAIRE